MTTQQQPTPLIDNQLLTIEGLAKFLSVSPATIRDWVFKRQIPFRKLGRLVRFYPPDIQEWLEKGSRHVCRED